MKKLLVISTDDTLLLTLWTYLESASLTLLVTTSGWVGWQMAQAENPDAILCAVNSPGLDGYEVLQAVRSHPLTARIPFILVSQQTDLESRCMAIALGADDYLVQPIPLNQLLLAINLQLQTNYSVSNLRVDSYSPGN